MWFPWRPGITLKLSNRPPCELATSSFIFKKIQVISWLQKENCWNEALPFCLPVLFTSPCTSPSPVIFLSMLVCVCAQLHPTLCYPIDCSLPGSSVHGLFMARILEWAAILSSRESSQPRDRTHVSHIEGGFFTSESLGKQFVITQCKSLSSC